MTLRACVFLWRLSRDETSGHCHARDRRPLSIVFQLVWVRYNWQSGSCQATFSFLWLVRRSPRTHTIAWFNDRFVWLPSTCSNVWAYGKRTLRRCIQSINPHKYDTIYRQDAPSLAATCIIVHMLSGPKLSCLYFRTVLCYIVFFS